MKKNYQFPIGIHHSHAKGINEIKASQESVTQPSEFKDQAIAVPDKKVTEFEGKTIISQPLGNQTLHYIQSKEELTTKTIHLDKSAMDAVEESKNRERSVATDSEKKSRKTTKKENK